MECQSVNSEQQLQPGIFRLGSEVALQVFHEGCLAAWLVKRKRASIW